MQSSDSVTTPDAACGRPSRLLATGLIAALLLVTGACTTGSPAGPGQFNDPYEGTNRNIHAFNKGVDRALYRPVSTAYGTVVPGVVRAGVNNFARFIDLPRQVVNDLLQGNVEDGLHNTFRFAVNATFGFLGVIDTATSFGIEERETDFGETLHIWGAGEGAYIAVPFFGPSTQRDLTGDVVDFVTNPLTFVLTPPASFAGPAATVGENADYRYTFRDSINALLDDSVDSYAQSRLIYLESRRLELGIPAGGPGTGTGESGIIDPFVVDPYEELFGE